MTTAVPAANLIAIRFDKRRKQDRAALLTPTNINAVHAPTHCIQETMQTHDIGHT